MREYIGIDPDTRTQYQLRVHDDGTHELRVCEDGTRWTAPVVLQPVPAAEVNW